MEDVIQMCREWQKFNSFLEYGYQYEARGLKNGEFGECLGKFITRDEAASYFEIYPYPQEQYDYILVAPLWSIRENDVERTFRRFRDKRTPRKYATDEYGAILS